MADWPVLPSNCVLEGGTYYWKALTPSGTAHVKGSWFTITDSLVEYDCYAIIVACGGNWTALKYFFDIGIGGPGSEQVIISNLTHTAVSTISHLLGTTIVLPIQIPAGTRISGRVQTNTTSTADLNVKLHYLPASFLSARGFSEVISMGAVTADTTATTPDPGASINTKGSYAEFDSSTTKHIKGIAIGAFDFNTTMSNAVWAFDVSVGGAGSEQVIVPNILFGATTLADTVSPRWSAVYPVDIPIGSRISVRSMCSINDATDRLLPIVLYGVV